ncbi:hypothetical protein [Schleiferilactobacillus shenzhenensis]|uniref:Uncharacterized protein n=1 Tax=Schleiferilactobacillus shenzhenensis LY-73 TaxID=1231336 RepID=U4TR72_9LACO|nr:hypothetical protein [Schleiferilactobacillus shenzhenensis]ERL66719.1 hypothetical protein L248_0398 [Schleiferilactobacillus shenzhenensis LY-73]
MTTLTVAKEGESTMVEEERRLTAGVLAPQLGITPDRLRRLSVCLEENGVPILRNSQRARLYSPAVVDILQNVIDRMAATALPMKATVQSVLNDDEAQSQLPTITALSATVQSQQEEITQLRQLVATVIEQNTQILAMLHDRDPHLTEQARNETKRDVTGENAEITSRSADQSVANLPTDPARPAAKTTHPAASDQAPTAKTPHRYLDPSENEAAVEHNVRPKTLADMQLPADEHPRHSLWDRLRGR